jgi:hypothetical protein
MTRSQIRYALFRCKAGTPSEVHERVLTTYLPELQEIGLDVDSFTVDWDVSMEDPKYIVTGHMVRLYNRNIPISV